MARKATAYKHVQGNVKLLPTGNKAARVELVTLSYILWSFDYSTWHSLGSPEGVTVLTWLVVSMSEVLSCLLFVGNRISCEGHPMLYKEAN